MAIRFTPDYNARIRKIVNNYNQKVRRAKTEGKINKSELPDRVSIKSLKSSYSNRRDLERELKNLEMFSRKSVRQSSKNVISDYALNLIEANRAAAIKHYEKQAALVRDKVKNNFPGERGRLRALEIQLDMLKKGPKSASNRDLVAMEKSVEDYRKSFERRASGYRGFLSEVEMIMDLVGVDPADKDKFFNKFSELNEQEFYDLYEKSDLINAIYELADSPKYTGGELVLHNSKGSAKQMIEALLEQQDFLINQVKQK